MPHFIFVILFVLILALSGLAQDVSSGTSSAPKPRLKQSPKEFYLAGETALQKGDLNRAESAFRQVVALDPQSAGAYANLGVIYMRRKQWPEALRTLHRADRLAPTVAGIRLNIGLVHFRQNDFRGAIAPFESVLRDQPDSSQARYLLGLCYFLSDRYAEAAETLEPLWGQQSLNLSYLYVLGIAAYKAKRNELEEHALFRLVEVGQDTPEFHLLMGKAYLNRQEDDKAIAEFQHAAQANPKLPFLHFNLGLAYLHKQDYEHAAQEFQQDIAVEPDVPYTYDKLGTVYALEEKDEAAEKNFRQALRLDSHLGNSYLGLAKLYKQHGRYPEALAALNSLEKLDPEDYNAHYLRGQVLQRMGQREKAKLEFDTYTRMMNAAREKRGKELSGEIPNPELTIEPE